MLIEEALTETIADPLSCKPVLPEPPMQPASDKKKTGSSGSRIRRYKFGMTFSPLSPFRSDHERCIHLCQPRFAGDVAENQEFWLVAHFYFLVRRAVLQYICPY